MSERPITRRDETDRTRRLLLLGLASTPLVPALLCATAASAQAARSGMFRGAGGHEASGSVRVENGHVVFGDDFRLDRAPDPYVAFGSAGSFTPGTDFAVLRSRRGAQSYPIPASIDPNGHAAVWLWCRRFSTPLGVARLR